MDTNQRYYKLLAVMTAGLIIGAVSFGLILLRQRQDAEMAQWRDKIQKLENAPKAQPVAVRPSVAPLPAAVEEKYQLLDVSPLNSAKVDPLPQPAKPVAMAVAPRPERIRPVAVAQSQSDGRIKAIRIATLFQPWQVKVETGDVRIQTALKVCGKRERQLSLIIKKADDGSMPVLVVGSPAIDEGSATGYAVCLESALPRYGGKINRVEMVPLSDFGDGFATVAQASAHRI